jgi:hypothetical protein
MKLLSLWTSLCVVLFAAPPLLSESARADGATTAIQESRYSPQSIQDHWTPNLFFSALPLGSMNSPPDQRIEAPPTVVPGAAPPSPAETPAVAPAATPSATTSLGAPPSVAAVFPNVFPLLWYWENGSYQNHNKSICSVNAAPTITFYVQYQFCNTNGCGGGIGANPYRWTVSLYRDASLLYKSTPFQTSTVWINSPVTLPTPLQPGVYYAKLKLEIRQFIATWVTKFDQNTLQPYINFTSPANPPAQAPVPIIRLEVVANSGSDMIYQLRGWQTNGNTSLIGQWNIFNSDSMGTVGALIVSQWSTPGQPYTINQNLNLGSWYLLQYGNYSSCLSWNDTKRLIYINKQ